MTLSLQEAADLAGVNKTTLFRAVKAGKVSASRDEHGQWRLDPAEVSGSIPLRTAMRGNNTQCRENAIARTSLLPN